MALKGQVPNVYSVGLQNVGSYQVSGIPWVTGSSIVGNGAGLGGVNGEDKLSFPYVTKSILVTRTAGNDPLCIAFAPKAQANVVSGRHYWSLVAAGDSVTLNVKCTDLYLFVVGPGGSDTADYEMVVELTNIPTGRMYALAGSGIDE
jgi:hypothetical protein